MAYLRRILRHSWSAKQTARKRAHTVGIKKNENCACAKSQKDGRRGRARSERNKDHSSSSSIASCHWTSHTSWRSLRRLLPCSRRYLTCAQQRRAFRENGLHPTLLSLPGHVPGIVHFTHRTQQSQSRSSKPSIGQRDRHATAQETAKQHLGADMCLCHDGSTPSHSA